MQHEKNGLTLARDRKQQFDIERVFRRIRTAIEPFPKAAMFQLAEEGFSSPFEQLVACLISVRTRDETTIPIARRLFSVARAPAELENLTVERDRRADSWNVVPGGQSGTYPEHRHAYRAGL